VRSRNSERSQISEAWRQATSRQEDVHFSFSVWSVQDMTGVAHWHTTFKRVTTGKAVEIDGVLSATFDRSGRCVEFREWWHGNEAD
jgi:SnoaL-like domain